VKQSDGKRLAAIESKAGRWRGLRRNVHVSGLYGPWVELEGLVSMFLEARVQAGRAAGTRPTKEAGPQRRVRSAGITL
jgi:hypothetical protein